MEKIISRYMHNVMIFTTAKDPTKKVEIMNYIAPKVYIAKQWFKQDHPNRKLIKAVSLGVKLYEIEASKYYAIYEDT
jgi:hypothetical protein